MLVSVIRRFQVCLYLGIAISVSDGLLVTIGSRVTILAFSCQIVQIWRFFKAFGMKILVWHFFAIWQLCCSLTLRNRKIETTTDVSIEILSVFGNSGYSVIRVRSVQGTKRIRLRSVRVRGTISPLVAAVFFTVKVDCHLV